MILNLGCGTKPMAGAFNHDRTKHHPYVDMAFDLNEYPWPLEAAYDEIHASDVLEHLDNAVWALEECWRLLKPGGILQLRVPYGMGENALTDPTHRTHFMPKSMDYFIRGTEFEKEYGYYAKMRWKLIESHWDVGEDNLYWTLQKDEPA